jgi:hypothetical protein
MFRESLAKFFKVDSLIENLTGYVEARVEILKHEAKEEIVKQVSNLVVYLLVGFIFAVVLIFFSVSIALKISESLGGFAGFGIVSLCYLIVGVVLFLNRTQLIGKVEHKVRENLNKKKK